MTVTLVPVPDVLLPDSAAASAYAEGMVRIAMILVAVVAGVVCALLLAIGPKAEVSGETVTCPAILVVGENKGGGGGDLSGPCEAALDRFTWYAVAAGAVALVAGTGAVFRRPENARANATPPESIDIR
jgi:hypothetical protein